MAPLSNVLKTTVYLFVVASFATLIGYYRLVSIESAHLTARVQHTNELDQQSHHDSVQSLKDAEMNITKAGFAASFGKDWDFQSRRVVEWPDPLVSKFEFNRANGTKTGRPEVVIAMNRKSLSASNFAFAKSKTRGEQSLVGCLPGGREQLAPLYDILPKDDPFRGQKFGSCAVVGNSGILARSGCGPEIDAHDVVFRINEGRTGYSKGKGGFTTTARSAEKFTIDVGSKTTLRMILGELAMKETEDTSGSNALYMDPPGAMRMLAWPCPQGEGHTAWVQQSHVKEKILRTIADISGDKRQDKGIMFLSPEPLLQLRRSLALSPTTPDPSLGLQIAAVAMNVCGRVSLYGFNRTSNPYHYWDEKEAGPNALHPFATQAKKTAAPSSLLVWSEEDAVMESLGRLCPLVCLQTKKCRKRSDPQAAQAPPALDTTPAASKRANDAMLQLRSALQGELDKGDSDDKEEREAEAGAAAAAAAAAGGGLRKPGKGGKPSKAAAAAAAADAEADAMGGDSGDGEEAPAEDEVQGRGKGKLKGRKTGEESEGAGKGSKVTDVEELEWTNPVLAKFQAKQAAMKAAEGANVDDDGMGDVQRAEAVLDAVKKKKKGGAAANAAAGEEDAEAGEEEEEAEEEEEEEVPAPASKKGKASKAKEKEPEAEMEHVNPYAALHAKVAKAGGGANPTFGRDATDDEPVRLPVWGAFGEDSGEVAGMDDSEEEEKVEEQEAPAEPEPEPAAAGRGAAKRGGKGSTAAGGGGGGGGGGGVQRKASKAKPAPEPEVQEAEADAGNAEEGLVAPDGGVWGDASGGREAEDPAQKASREFFRTQESAPTFDQAALEAGLNADTKRGGKAAVRPRGEVDRDLVELDELDEGPKRPHGLFATRLRSDPAAQRGGRSDSSDEAPSRENFFGDEAVSDGGSDVESDRPRGRSRRRAQPVSDTSGGTDGATDGGGSDSGARGGNFISSLRGKGGRRDGDGSDDQDEFDEHGNPYRSAMLFSGRGR